MDKTQRLCDNCVNGVVVRGHNRQDPAQTHEEVICLFMGRIMEIDVTGCSRFAECAPKSAHWATAQASTAWVA